MIGMIITTSKNEVDHGHLSKPGIFNSMKVINALDGGEIKKKMISDDQSLFEILYEKYSSKMFGFLITRMESTEKAEELLIKVFSKVWEQIKTLNENEEKKIMVILFCTCRDNRVSSNRLLTSLP
jgi:hypothetical protein